MKKRKHKLIILMLMIGMMTLSMMRNAEVTFADNQVITGEQNSETSQIIGDVTPTPERYFTYTKNDALSEVTITGLKTDETPAITELIIPETIDGMKVTTIEAHAFRSKEFLISVIIPDSVEFIGTSAFFGCTNLSSVKIGNSVKSIGYNVFYFCKSLMAINIPDSVKSIGESAFAFCDSLDSVTIPDSVESIGKNAFECCVNLSTVKIGDSVKNIGEGAFSVCMKLDSVTIPDSVESMGRYTFEGCTSLTSVKIGKSVKSIGVYTFNGCTSLTSVVLPNTITRLETGAFAGSSVNNLIFICQDINNMNISVSDSIPEDIHVYRMAEGIKVTVKEIVSYEFIGKSLLLEEFFETGAVYMGATGTNQYEGSEIKLEDYFDISVTSYALVGDKTSRDTKIIDNQLYIGEDETSENLSIQVTHGEMSKQVPIQIVKAESLSIKEEPQSTYDENKTYDPNGLVLTMTYEDGYEKNIEYRDDNDEITFEYQTVDMNITEQIIKYKGFEVKQPLTIYGHQTLSDSESGIQIIGILTNNSLLKIEKINDTDAIIYNNSNDKELIMGYDVQIIGEYKEKLTVIFDVGNEHNGKKVYIRHIKHDGSLEEFEETVSEGKIAIEVTEFSPFMIYVDKELNRKPNINISRHPTPEILDNDKLVQQDMIPTGDNDEMLLWGVIGSISMGVMISIKKFMISK